MRAGVFLRKVYSEHMFRDKQLSKSFGMLGEKGYWGGNEDARSSYFGVSVEKSICAM